MENKIRIMGKAIQVIYEHGLYKGATIDLTLQELAEQLDDHQLQVLYWYIVKNRLHITDTAMDKILPQPQQELKAQYCCCYESGKVNTLCPIHKPLPPEPIELCGICGGKQIYIRGRYPHTDNRLTCPTCCQERLDQIRDVSDKDYGKCYKTNP